MERLFILLLMVCAITTVFSQNITKAEYFFDADPGPGNGRSVTIPSPAETVNFSTNIPTTGLNSGFHVLTMRVYDANGRWSRSESRGFYIWTQTTNTGNITGAEYFFDSDPGPGNGVVTPVGTAGSVVSFTASVPASLSTGFHFLGIRTKDSDGKWGFFDKRNFYVSGTTPDMPAITAAEYFFDHDPGEGNGTPLTINSPGYVIAQNFTINVPNSLSDSTHLLTIRVRDQAGNWSLFETTTITVTNTTITCPGNVMVYAASGQCTSVVNNIDPVISPSGAAYTYTLSGATTGSGNGSASGHTFNAGITTVTYALTNSPGINCSFTVTVNANILPLVNIDASTTTICSGNQVSFTAYPMNGGNIPSYQWKLNGNNVGGDSATYKNSSLVNNDKVTVVMTSSLGCANPKSATSNEVTMTVGQSVTPLVSIVASPTSICAGTPVTFTATPTNGGTPSYQWKLNGNNVGGDSATYKNSSLVNNDKVTVMMTSSFGCASPKSATSNEVTMTVGQSVTPLVSIVASPTSICAGTPVTFTATPTNGGTPLYQWKLNGNNVGGDSATYKNSSLVNNDKVTVVMTSSLGCASPKSATSNEVTMTVGQSVTPLVSIVASPTSICAGTPVTFTATPTNGGAPSYQWKLNGNNVGGDSNIYQNSSLSNGDIVSVTMTSSLTCASQPTVSSNNVSIAVTSTVTPSVSIVVNSTALCPGSVASFTATPTNGGNPSYQWKLNGNNVGISSDVYENSNLVNGDQVYVIMTSSLNCVTSLTANSNTIQMGPPQAVTPDVSITSSATSICPGTTVTFTATPTNGGETPRYEWKKNGEDVGTDSFIYEANDLVNGDVITVLMSSWLNCVTKPTDTSNAITINVVSSVTPSVGIEILQTTICSGQLVTFTAIPTNGGDPSYQWKLNGNNVGGDSATYNNSSLVNNDKVKVVMTSSLGCASPKSVTSDEVTMTLGQSVTPLVSIVAPPTSICAGTQVTFTATPTNGGDPSYQWKLNGNNVGGDSATYKNSSLVNNDKVTVVMTSSLGCASPKSVTSNEIAMTVTTLLTYYRDLDGDGYGNASSGTIQACGATAGYVLNNTDCNDSNASAHPGASEICGNGIDDNCNGIVDENCSDVTLPVMTLRTYPAKEGDIGETTLNLVVTLDVPAPLPVSVHYATANGDAMAGSDYVATSGSLFIPAGSSSGTIAVKIIGDVLKESNERFSVNFSDPVNVTLGVDPSIHIMIIDDDKGRPNNTITHIDKTGIEEQLLKIPSVARRNQVWMIPQIGMYENEVLIMSSQGQLINRFANYRNHTPLGNIASGLYFYRIRILDGKGQVKYYAGSLLVTE